MNPVYIYDTVRTPRGRAHPEKGALREIPSIDLLKIVFTALEHRNKLDTSLVDEIALGCSSATGEQGANIAKIASLYAGWHPRANGVTISSFRTSGLEAVEFAALKIMAGVASCAVAGGVESLTRVPIFSDRGPWFSDPNVARQTGFIPMGLAADLIANLEGFTHQDLDRYAL
jgi:acetyl-CoA C-acetyltransferase